MSERFVFWIKPTGFVRWTNGPDGKLVEASSPVWQQLAESALLTPPFMLTAEGPLVSPDTMDEPTHDYLQIRRALLGARVALADDDPLGIVYQLAQVDYEEPAPAEESAIEMVDRPSWQEHLYRRDRAGRFTRKFDVARTADSMDQVTRVREFLATVTAESPHADVTDVLWDHPDNFDSPFWHSFMAGVRRVFRKYVPDRKLALVALERGEGGRALASTEPGWTGDPYDPPDDINMIAYQGFMDDADSLILKNELVFLNRLMEAEQRDQYPEMQAIARRKLDKKVTQLVSAKLVDNRVESVAVHEAGHAIYFWRPDIHERWYEFLQDTYGTTEDARFWENGTGVRQDALLVDHDKMTEDFEGVSEYATYMPFEAFAETFTAYEYEIPIPDRIKRGFEYAMGLRPTWKEDE